MASKRDDGKVRVSVVIDVEADRESMLETGNLTRMDVEGAVLARLAKSGVSRHLAELGISAKVG